MEVGGHERGRRCRCRLGDKKVPRETELVPGARNPPPQLEEEPRRAWVWGGHRG